MHLRLRMMVPMLLLVVASSLCAEPLTRIGIIAHEGTAPRWREALPRVLGALGYWEGANIKLEWRTFTSSVAQAKTHAEELVHSDVRLILALTSPAVKAAMESTTRIPIVFVSGDPVAMGFAQSLARPGHNATGVSMLATELTGKRFDLLRQMAPRTRRVTYLRNPTNPLAQIMYNEATQAARTLGLKLEVVDVSGAAQLPVQLAAFAKRKPDALVISEDLMFATPAAMAQLTAAARNLKLPAVYPWSEFHEYGALMSYSILREDSYRRVSAFIDRILKGAKPEDLPVEQLSRYELVVNVKEAEAIKLKVPQEILYRAEKVIR